MELSELNAPNKPMQMQSVKNGPEQPLSHYLRHILNANCLIEVFQYLEFSDLLSVCGLDTETDPFFTNLINDRMIGLTLIDVDVEKSQENKWPLSKIFQVFGTSMRKINLPIHKYHLNDILEAIVDHCAPDTLTEIHVIIKKYRFSGDSLMPLQPELLQRSIPYLRRVRKLVMEGVIFWDIFKYFFVLLLNECNLQELNLMNFTMEHFVELIKVDSLKVKILRLFNIHIGRDSTVNFLRKMPYLEVISSDCTHITNSDLVWQCCPKIRKLGLISMANDTVSLHRFDHLTEVTLEIQATSQSTLERTLQRLAEKNMLQKLIICCIRSALGTHRFRFGPLNFVNGFRSLKHVEFHLRFAENFRDNKLFVQNLLKPMKELRTISVINERTSNMHEILDSVQCIQEFIICQVDLLQTAREIRKIKKTLDKIMQKRLELGPQEPIHLVLNSKQAEYYRRLRSNEKFIKVSVKKRINRYFDELYNF